MKNGIPNYYVRGANGYFQPTRDMKALGFVNTALGPDGPEARAKAEELNARWQRVRRMRPPAFRKNKTA